jgi:hypothetical protein
MNSKIFLFFLVSFIGSLSGESLNVNKVTLSDISFQPHKEEGYFQGWNYSFQNKDYIILATFLVSNLGPNDLNNGISLSIKSARTGNYFITKEFGDKTLVATKGNFDIKIYANSMTYSSGVYEIKIFTEDVKLELRYKPLFPGITLSGGKFIVKDPDKFVRADIGFAWAESTGYIDYKGEVIPLEGKGGMEHLITNYEVYKYSTQWEIIRTKSPEGNMLFSGGFYGNKNMKIPFFRTVAVQSPIGEILYSSRILSSEPEGIFKEPYSGYNLASKEKIFMDDSKACSAEIVRVENINKINLISNVSAVLRFFINLFFANPYQVNYFASITPNCQEFPSGNYLGIHSQFLINHK